MSDGPIEPAKKRVGRSVVVHLDGRVTARYRAAFVDLDRSRYGELKARGLFVEHPEGGYDLGENNRRYVRHLREQVSGRSASAGELL